MSAAHTSSLPETVHVTSDEAGVMVIMPPSSLVIGTDPGSAVKVKVKPVPPLGTLPDKGLTIMSVTPVRITVAVAVAGSAWALALMPALPGAAPTMPSGKPRPSATRKSSSKRKKKAKR